MQSKPHRPEGGSPSPGGDPQVVLVVEDDPEGREMYARLLSNAGFSVREAHNGHQALAKALEEPPDIVVTDLALPGIDGFELCRQLRQHGSTARVPIIAVTGRFFRQNDRERAERDGCSAVLLKPCPPELLIAEVRQAIAASASTSSKHSSDR
jgi:CheY-like chemotaxis protein